MQPRSRRSGAAAAIINRPWTRVCSSSRAELHGEWRVLHSCQYGQHHRQWHEAICALLSEVPVDEDRLERGRGSDAFWRLTTAPQTHSRLVDHQWCRDHAAHRSIYAQDVHRRVEAGGAHDQQRQQHRANQQHDNFLHNYNLDKFCILTTGRVPLASKLGITARALLKQLKQFEPRQDEKTERHRERVSAPNQAQPTPNGNCNQAFAVHSSGSTPGLKLPSQGPHASRRVAAQHQQCNSVSVRKRVCERALGS